MPINYSKHLPRLLSKVSPEPNSGCWLWMGRTDSGGYGVVEFYDPEAAKRGKKSISKCAHGAMYRAIVGPVPEGLDLDHICRVRSCVNPAHLEPVMRRENIRRGICGEVNGKRMRDKTHCPRGHEYTPKNTFVTQGGRKCWECRRVFEAARRGTRKRVNGKLVTVKP